MIKNKFEKQTHLEWWENTGSMWMIQGSLWPWGFITSSAPHQVVIWSNKCGTNYFKFPSFFLSLSLYLFVFILSLFLVIAINSCCSAILLVHLWKWLVSSSAKQLLHLKFVFFVQENFKVITYHEYLSSKLFVSCEVFVMSRTSEVHASCNCSSVENKSR